MFGIGQYHTFLSHSYFCLRWRLQELWVEILSIVVSVGNWWTIRGQSNKYANWCHKCCILQNYCTSNLSFLKILHICKNTLVPFPCILLKISLVVRLFRCLVVSRLSSVRHPNAAPAWPFYILETKRNRRGLSLVSREDDLALWLNYVSETRGQSLMNMQAHFHDATAIHQHYTNLVLLDTYDRASAWESPNRRHHSLFVF